MAAPTLTSIAPASGPTAGGTVVTLVGTSLDTVTAVAFGATPASDFSALSAVLLVAVAPAGTSTASVKVTNPDGDSGTLAYQFTDGLFTAAEARAFNRGQLADESTYSDSAITSKESEIREWLTRVCGVDFVSTTHTDEYHSGDGTAYLVLDWPRVSSVTAASTRSGSTWTALTADELADLHAASDATGLLYREGSYWPRGVRNLKLTYVAGYSAVPALVKRAALLIAVAELPTSNVPMQAESWDDGGVSVSFARGDGFNDAWHRIPDVVKAIRLYSHRPPAVA